MWAYGERCAASLEWLWATLLLAVLIVALPAQTSGQDSVSVPCLSPDLPVYSIENKHAYFYFNGSKVGGWPKSPIDGAKVPSGELSVQVDSIVEVKPYFNGNESVCRGTTNLGFQPPTIDSYSTTFVKELNLSSTTMCHVQRTTLSFNGGIDIPAVIVNVTWPEYPNTSVIYTYSVWNGDEKRVIKSFPATNKTLGYDLEYAYSPQGLKIAIDVYNFPWGVDPSNLVLFMSVDRQSAADYLRNLSISDPDRVQDVSLSWAFSEFDFALSGSQTIAPMPKYDFLVSFERTVVADDEAYLIYQAANNAPGTLEGAPLLGSIPVLYFSLPLCSKESGFFGLHYDHLWYDPSIAFLFAGDATAPTTPNQAKKSNTVAIAVGVSVGVIAAIVAGIVIAAIVSPRVQTIFRPFSARGRVRGGPHSDKEIEIDRVGPPESKPRSESGWAPAKKPNA